MFDLCKSSVTLLLPSRVALAKLSVQTYAEYGKSLIIWNGLDMDWVGNLGSTATSNDNGCHNLMYIWYLQLCQPFNPDNLPGGMTVAGLTLSSQTATNEVTMTHTVLALVADNLANPVSGVTVDFTVVSGPSVGHQVVALRTQAVKCSCRGQARSWVRTP